MNLSRRSKAILSYVIPIVTGIIFLAIEKEDEFVRKCAAQSLAFGIAVSLLNVCVSTMPFLGSFFSFIVESVSFALWVVLMIKAGSNVYYRLPVISDISEKYFLNLFK